jgi:small-conductance mechanosensitive channel
MIEQTSQAIDYLVVLQPAFLFIGVVLVGVLIERVLLVWLKNLVKRTQWEFDNIVLNVIRRTTIFWSLLLATYLTLFSVEINSTITGYIHSVLLVLFILSITFALIQVGNDMIEVYGGKGNLPSLSIIRNVVRIVLFLIGVLTILALFGVPITPTLAALGVGGLAVSLALQDTLTNLISGIQLIVDRQIRTGDYVQLSSGEQGYIRDISWRTTQIQQLSNNLVIVPNATLATATIVNFHQPEQELSVLFEVGVSYDSDLEQVEKVTIAVAKEVMQEVPGGIPENEPFIRYHTFDNSSINLTIILRGQQFVDQYLIKHEFVKRLHRRYRQEGIEIPFPIRTVYTRGDAGKDGGLAS